MTAFGYQALAIPTLRSNPSTSLVKSHTIVSYDYQSISSNPRVDFLDPPSENDIVQAEKILGYSLPPLARQWIRDFGSLQINPDVPSDAKLLLLGLSPESSIDDDIILFNDSTNPTLPARYFVFAHEFDGSSDIVYALLPNSNVASVKNNFAFPYFRQKDGYHDVKWKIVFESLEQFWLRKVERYLTW